MKKHELFHRGMEEFSRITAVLVETLWTNGGLGVDKPTVGEDGEVNTVTVALQSVVDFPLCNGVSSTAFRKFRGSHIQNYDVTSLRRNGTPYLSADVNNVQR